MMKTTTIMHNIKKSVITLLGMLALVGAGLSFDSTPQSGAGQ